MVRVKRASRSSLSKGQQYGLYHHWMFLCLFCLCAAFYMTFVMLTNQEERGSASSMFADASSLEHIVSSGKPFLVYGTAWKEKKTAEHVMHAIQAGFRFIDTACQPKHYNEAGVGMGWKAAAAELGLTRQDLFLQTKYSPAGGQDKNNMPYDADASIEDQVKASVAVSLKNLQTDYIDSLVLHSPLPTMEETIRAWRAMEDFVIDGTIKRLGISNTYDLQKFTQLYEAAHTKPSVLQNRFYAQSNFDTDLRVFCKRHNIWYQSFWTLTANRQALGLAQVKELAEAKALTPQTYLFAFLMSLGHVTPLSGTTSRMHMAEDVGVMERMQGGEVIFESDAELRQMAQLLGMPDL